MVAQCSKMDTAVAKAVEKLDVSQVVVSVPDKEIEELPSDPVLVTEVGGGKGRMKMEEGEWIVPPSRKIVKVARGMGVSTPLDSAQ